MNIQDPVNNLALTRAERTRSYLEVIEEERAQQIALHQQAVSAMRAMAPGTTRPLNIYADGDSWFEYPLPPFNPTDVIVSLRAQGTPKPIILDLAHHGDEARDKLGVSQRHRIIQNLTDPANGTFDAILFSGGGNDTVGEQFCLWLHDAVQGMTPSQAINVPRLAAVLGVVRSAYEDLIAIRNKFASQCTVFFHAYDFAIPSNKGVCGLGPWLEPSLVDRGWPDLVIGTQIVKEFLLQFDNMVTQIEQANDNIVYVRTQGTLASNEWANELHPTPQGFGKIAAKFRTAIQSKFPGRI